MSINEIPVLQQELDRKATAMLTELVRHLRRSTMSKSEIVLRAETVWQCYAGLITDSNKFMVICETIIEEAKAMEMAPFT